MDFRIAEHCFKFSCFSSAPPIDSLIFSVFLRIKHSSMSISKSKFYDVHAASN